MRKSLKVLLMLLLLALIACGTAMGASKTCKHAHTKWVVEIKATCVEPGLENLVCQDCGEFLDERNTPVNPNNHKWGSWKTKKEATCTKDGLKVRVCEYCQETQKKTIPATGHDYTWKTTKEATCTEDGSRKGTCRHCKNQVTETIPAKGHKAVKLPGKAATCTEPGLTDGKKCSVCGTVLKKQKEIPAKGHKSVKVPGKAATCTEPGLTDGRKCSVCGKVLKKQKKIPALGHDWGDWKRTKEPTTTEQGQDIRICRRDSSHVDMRRVPVLEPDPAIQLAVTWDPAEESVAKDAGDGFEVRYTITNTGNCTVWFSRPDQACFYDFDMPGEWNNEPGSKYYGSTSLEPGQSMSYTYLYPVDETDVAKSRIDRYMGLSGSYEKDGAWNVVECEPVHVEIPITVAAPAIHFEVSWDPSQEGVARDVGDGFEFRYTVTNTGNCTLFYTWGDERYFYDYETPGEMVWMENLGRSFRLEAGEKLSVTYLYLVDEIDAAKGMLDLYLDEICFYPKGSQWTEVRSNAVQLEIPITLPAPALTAEVAWDKDAGVGKRVAGAWMEWRYTLTNSGNCPLLIPHGDDMWFYDYETPGDVFDREGIGRTYRLEPGEQMSYTYKKTVTDYDLEEGVVYVSTFQHGYYERGGVLEEVRSNTVRGEIPLTLPISEGSPLGELQKKHPGGSPLVITSQPQGGRIGGKEGDSVTLSVEVSGGVPPYSYQWYYDSRTISGMLNSTGKTSAGLKGALARSLQSASGGISQKIAGISGVSARVFRKLFLSGKAVLSEKALSDEKKAAPLKLGRRRMDGEDGASCTVSAPGLYYCVITDSEGRSAVSESAAVLRDDQ